MDGDELGDDDGVVGGVEFCAGGGGRRWMAGIGRGGRTTLGAGARAGRGGRRARPAAAGGGAGRGGGAGERDRDRRCEERKREERRSRAAVNITLFSAAVSVATENSLIFGGQSLDVKKNSSRRK
jgi:hypothetical protein